MSFVWLNSFRLGDPGYIFKMGISVDIFADDWNTLLILIKLNISC